MLLLEENYFNFMKKTIIIIVVAVGLLFGGVWWSKSLTKNDPDIISRNGLHWHPELFIFVKGVKEEIPTNIGVGFQYAGLPGYDQNMKMTGVHTHDTSGIIHFEFSGLVRKKDLTLGQFFKIWGKDISSFGVNMKMTVNGKENTEYENYIMQDKDKIELRYE
ncbi:MAG: hypothetical protein A3G47_01130 [Candidatus Zambryskibacteria bacterium RIFCSPLOWO2_12_FULL_39_45]|uniref:Uncharacterized protein n=2 Tax=Candidatus Zambryskiibacteriota TaxID=1817925 RepID=A0A1G2T8L9_9BACT|nr:MAG: hypothetical protein UT81_C0011G0013 [Parcubacteria group bacterium GW2011_GWA2_40_14]OHA93613.1 MAG: hypothetical protein A2W58_01660 [Candidatus Zambryskibacteria bacterium RIFCSPHIGHO2_02_38_10.5]OHA96254.1 MAG: hypothetical protein A3C63_02435 [Candidatus Zambryskibacteria bacterium RIFCSPHIGHO2_02_FULL_39_82]OHA97795.1 MAG: hypothetical protein A3E32_00180 [Candidatus Zambryskibacteria bacterium RIFCSPHIGHO2_12_FULL_38_37]OHB08814.1 MAG: hypothetical protein A2W64_02760 [Candidatus